MAMGLPNGSADDFRNNLSGRGIFSPALKALIARAKEHFGAEFDLNILIPYAFLRYVSIILLLYISPKSLERRLLLQEHNIILHEEPWLENMAKLLMVLS
jgi:hypothetical protein